MERNAIQNRRSEKTKKIVSAGLFSRTIAAIVDLAIVAFVAGIFYMGGQTIAQNTSVVKDNVNLQREYYVASGLFEYVMDGEEETLEVTPKITSTDYKDYENMIVNYFTVYKTSECPEDYRDSKYTMYWYNVHVLGLEEDPLAVPYTDLDSLPNFTVRGKNIFTYDDSEIDKYNARPILKEDTETMRNAALRYYYIPTDENTDNDNFVYNYATVDLRSTEFFYIAESTMNLWLNFVPIIIGIVLSSIIFYFVIPICTKNGQTLGKMTFHIGIVNELGYQIKKVQLIPRFIFELFLLAAAYLICDFFIPYGLFVFLGIATVYFLASYLMMIFSKNNKSIHDIFAITRVIDMRQSTWFKDANEEAGVEKRISESQKIIFDETIDYRENPNVLYVNPDYENPENGDSGENKKKE